MQFCSSSECANQMHHFETAYLNEYLITSEIGFRCMQDKLRTQADEFSSDA
jgi:hypothetical protein